MPKRRDPVADANQRVRDLSNKLFGFDQEVALPLRTRVAGLERQVAELSAKAERQERLIVAYREHWESHVRLVAAQLASGKNGDRWPSR
jgi:hypothetical protein